MSLIIYVLICPFYKNKNAILAYHTIDYISKDNDPHKINVHPALFERQIAYIAKKKERFIVSFDDGYESIYLNAFPVIKEHNIKSILFITTDYIDRKIMFDRFFDYKYSPKPLIWEQIKKMNAAGVELGCHSLTHRNMASLEEQTAYLESFLSRKRITDMTGCNIISFAYPFGISGCFNEKTERILKDAGYEKAYTNMMGTDNSQVNPFRIKRIRIYNTDNMFRFRMKVSGAYNWVDFFTKIFKK